MFFSCFKKKPYLCGYPYRTKVTFQSQGYFVSVGFRLRNYKISVI